MKKSLALLTTSALLLAACGGPGADVIDPEVLSANPDLKEPAMVWGSLLTAHEKEDCEAAQALFEDGLESCDELFEYLADEAPIIDWERSDWSGSGLKVKVYELEEGSLTSFEYVNGEWYLSNEEFWNN